eukprot:1730089-Alexandrium_andersonii.AAC.1
MHINELGIGRDHVASHMVIWLRLGFFPEALIDDGLALRALWSSLLEFCKENGLKKPPGSFTLASIGNPSAVDHPEMSSSFKASAIKTMTAWVAELSFRFEDCSTDLSRAR